MTAKIAQNMMSAAGYDVGPSDGVIGPRFIAALDKLIADAKPCKDRLRPSARIIGFIKDFEQCRLKAYLPTSDDVPTIGWGSTGPDIKMGMTWTQKQADDRFARDLAEFADEVERAIADAPTTQQQFDAMVSIAYNIGVTAFKNSTLLKKHKAGDYEGAAAEFMRWNKQKSKVLSGLTHRRGLESAIYSAGGLT